MRFGRKHKDVDADGTAADGTAADEATQGGAEAPAPDVAPPRSRDLPEAGPYDVGEVDVEEGEWVDLGSLLLPPPQGAELRLQVDESSGEVMSVLMVAEDGALELRAFAASRGGGAWAELRPRIAAEVTRQGGTATEEQGTFGEELLARVPVTAPDGSAAVQASRFAGHEGPTWLLRTNLMGRPAVEPDRASTWEDVIRSVAVRRGPEAMAPGSPLPLVLPPEARRADEPPAPPS